MKAWLRDNSPVDGEDLERHDKWLCMMWPRLHLLRELLSEDGAIFISIDDNEQHHLRMMMDEIFGADNFVANIIWQKKFSPQNDAKYLSDNHDFVLCYAKNHLSVNDNGWRRNLLPRTESHNARYKFDDNDGRGPWSTADLSVKSYTPNYDYPIANPETGQVHNPPQGRCWITGPETMADWLAENRIYFGRNGNGRPILKRYLKDVKQGIVPLTIWNSADVGSTTTGRRIVLEVFHDRENPFDNPKAVGLIDRILRIATGPGAIILDSFAGSGTTAHAVLALNKEDGGNRKFILVECEDYADSITAERVRRVIKGVPDARDRSLQEGLGGSFTYCELGAPIDMEGMLTGDALPPFSALAAYLLHTASGLSAGEGELPPQNADGLFYRSDATDYYLLYEPDVRWLCGSEAMLNAERAKRIAAAVGKRGKKAVVFAAGKYIGQRELTQWGITFCQLPYELHRAE
jgi:adenine-specific DNA-methyltransferase